MNPSKSEKPHRKGDVSYVGVIPKSNTPSSHGSVTNSPVPHSSHGTPRATPVHYDYDTHSLSSIDVPGPFESHMSHANRPPVVHLGLISTPTPTQPTVPHFSFVGSSQTPTPDRAGDRGHPERAIERGHPDRGSERSHSDRNFPASDRGHDRVDSHHGERSHHSSQHTERTYEKLWDQRPVSYPPASLDNEWDAREEIRQRELEEARARAAQMEKTMRWWSDCTANWREKWSKVRNERNKAREDNRQLRAKLEAALNEVAAVKRDISELETERNELKIQVQNIQPEKDTNSVESGIDTGQKTPPEEADVISVSTSTIVQSPVMENKGVQISLEDLSEKITECVNCNNVNGDTNKNENCANNSDSFEEISLNSVKDDNYMDGSLVEQKIAAVSLKLDEAQKRIQAERDEKTQLTKQMDELQHELSSIKSKYDDLKHSNQDHLLEINQLRDEHEHELNRLSQELEDETSSKYNMDKMIADLRKELERLQAENAAEWGKRECLETEKISLERENKKLRHQITDMEENLGKRSKMAVMDNDMKIVQQDLHDKNKELADLKHSHNKVKKVLQERSTELEHSRRRSEQYEFEVKKLRCRIEELRKDLANAEDEVDNQTNNSRRIQRTNDELQEQMENMKVQFEHAKSRLRQAEKNLPRSSSFKSLDLNDTETATEPETDDDPI